MILRFPSAVTEKIVFPNWESQFDVEVVLLQKSSVFENMVKIISKQMEIKWVDQDGNRAYI